MLVKFQRKQIKSQIKSVFDIFKEENCSKTYTELLKMAREVNCSVNREQIIEIEKRTRAQSENQNWYAQRAGRITASKFMLVCHTSKSKPSVSIIKSICYPTKILFTTKVTSWGLIHENIAVEAYRRAFCKRKLATISCESRQNNIL